MSEDETAQRIRKAPTDSERTITYDPDSRPGVSALLDTASVCLDRTPEDIADGLGSKGSGALKTLATEAVNDFLRELRQRRTDLIASDAAEVLSSGNRAARRIAVETLDETRAAMGMIY